jgi:hypothetical protein
MKTLLLGIVTAASLAIAAPALAHPDDERGVIVDDWNNGGDNYGEFNQEYRHIWQGIQHGLDDGSYMPRQAQYFFRAMQQIRARADWQERRGDYDPEDIQGRIERLHETMHVAHARGHDRLDRWGDWGQSGGYYNYRARPYEYRR